MKQKSKLQLKSKTNPKWITALTKLAEAFKTSIAPPPALSLSQWADQYRVLGPETTAKPGPWKTLGFQKEPMDAITNPAVRRVVLFCASQILKTEVILNALAYSIHVDPCPILVVQPDENFAEDFSKDRIGGLIKYTPVVKERVYDSKTGVEDTRSTTLTKRFRGGFVSIASANVSASLSGKPIKKLFLDEVDRYKLTSGREGNPVTIARARMTTFWDSKEVISSSPGHLNNSIVVAEYETTDRSKWYSPCPHCGFEQILLFGGPEAKYGIKWDKNNPSDVWYQCIDCGGKIYEHHKAAMAESGRYIAEAPFVTDRGFWINILPAPWFSWARLVEDFLAAEGYPEKLQEFVKTRLAEAWEDRGETVDDDKLYARREPYPAQVPQGGFVLTAGVDVQHDRLEILVQAWGTDEECWDIEHAVIRGDVLKKDVWDKLEIYLNRQWQHESGSVLVLQSTCVDTSDGQTVHMAYAFVNRMRGRNVFAIKGVGGQGKPVVGPPSPKRSGKAQRPVELYPVGVDGIKETIYHRLRKTEVGSAYRHFPQEHWCHEEFFKQLTAEKIILKKQKNGYYQRTWENKGDRRNEILDCSVYSYAALKQLAPNWQEWKEHLIAKPQAAAGGAVQASGGPKFQRVKKQGLDFKNDVLGR